MKHKLLFVLMAALFTMCDSSGKGELQFVDRDRSVPAFNADSAYSQLSNQLQFGPRNPGSAGHQRTQQYLETSLQQYAGPQNVFTQNFTHEGYGGDSLAMANIIAAFNPSSSDRIMLLAHWDTRPRAENDPNTPNQPILGADDGASGVSVLLELARLFSQQPPPIGVDIILLDGEDYGTEGDMANYFLGARYWSNNPPVPGYNPRFGILLDMVGGRQARFPKEQYSMEAAPALVNELWTIAQNKGLGALFVDEQGGRISDDHAVINRIQHIPTIDIINHSVDANNRAEFPDYWHTTNDNADIIDRHTLAAVGEVLTELIYNRIK